MIIEMLFQPSCSEVALKIYTDHITEDIKIKILEYLKRTAHEHDTLREENKVRNRQGILVEMDDKHRIYDTCEYVKTTFHLKGVPDRWDDKSVPDVESFRDECYDEMLVEVGLLRINEDGDYVENE